MRRVTIMIPDDIQAALEAYVQHQPVPPSLASMISAPLREYLLSRNFTARPNRLQITPAKKGSEKRNISVRHDHYLARP